MKYKKQGRDAGGAANGDDSKKGGRDDVPPSVHLDITEYRGVDGNNGDGGGLGTGGGSTSFLKPLREEPTPGSGSGSGRGSSGTSSGRDPPEKRLTLFALRLAVLEKAASGLGKLAFAWATVVLLARRILLSVQIFR